MFTMNDPGDGELHDSARSVQMWFMLQLLAAKLFETWVMLTERFLQSNPPDVVGRLEPTYKASLEWLTDYFGNGQPFKDSALKIIRDKTAFHYDRINITEAAANLAAGENSIYLAQHPANSLYYMGSALVFRSLSPSSRTKRREQLMAVTGSACIRVLRLHSTMLAKPIGTCTRFSTA